MPDNTQYPATDSPEFHPQVIARRRDLATVDSRVAELNGELRTVVASIDALKANATPLPDPVSEVERVLSGARDPIGDDKRQQLERRRSELRRDVDTLRIFQSKAANAIGHAHHRATLERVKGPDVVAALRAIAVAAAALESANDAAREVVRALEKAGFQNLES